MYTKMFQISIICLIYIINYVLCGVLILSPKPYEIPSLKPFDENSYNHLTETFKKSKIVSFRINSDKIPVECKSLLDGKFSAYVPNIDYIPEDTLTFDDCNSVKKQIDVLNLDSSKTKVILIIHNRVNKIKRNVEDASSTSSTSTIPSISSSTSAPMTTTEENNIKNAQEKIITKYNSPDEPVVYYPEEKEKKALLYSARAPVLKENDTSYILGPGSFVIVDERDNYLRMSCTIPVENGKITLRFRFPKENGYWYLTFVEVVFPDLRTYNLTITKDVWAPMAFSYHCGGETVFSDASGSTTLTLYDLQVQPRVQSRRFSDAYNCVPFMTGPIWSGIFVSSLLCVGLIVGLSALGSIKTMDKFDNYKTKQLSITVFGE